MNNDRMTTKSSILNDRQKAVIETIRMRLNEKQSLEYLKDAGFDIGPATYYREKRKVESMKLKRLYHIAKIGFQDQHLERIDNTELCLRLMWENYHLEKEPFKRFQMLKDIIMVQPYLSSYYETTKLIFDKRQVHNEKLVGYDDQQDDDIMMINDDDNDDESKTNAKF